MRVEGKARELHSKDGKTNRHEAGSVQSCTWHQSTVGARIWVLSARWNGCSEENKGNVKTFVEVVLGLGREIAFSKVVE